jgi:protein associated with RNAse G/E
MAENGKWLVVQSAVVYFEITNWLNVLWTAHRNISV